MGPVALHECQRAYCHIQNNMAAKRRHHHRRRPMPLEGLCGALNAGQYMPGALKEAIIQKEDGSDRCLLIPTEYDRIAGRIALQRLESINNKLPESALGFRPGRGIQQALVETAAHLHNNPHSIIFKFDVKEFFPSVDYEEALAILQSQAPDPIALDILTRQYTRWGAEHGGVPQGCPGSPFLSNLVLRDLDEELEDLDIFYIRYADDGLIITEDEDTLNRAIHTLMDGLAARGLKLHDRKSKLIEDNWFEFLGILISRGGKFRIPPKAWLRREQLETDAQILGWHAHYCFSWRWNTFLNGARNRTEIVKSLTVEGDAYNVCTSTSTKSSLTAPKAAARRAIKRPTESTATRTTSTTDQVINGEEKVCLAPSIKTDSVQLVEALCV